MLASADDTFRTLNPDRWRSDMMPFRFLPSLMASALLLSVSSAQAQQTQSINIYTAREPALIRPVLDQFSRETGIKVNLVFAQNGLEERVRAEGQTSPADVLLNVDVSKMVEAVAMGITQPFVTPDIASAVPAAYRDPNGHWLATTLRARVFYVSKDRVKDTSLTYESLADDRWKGKVCIRDGQNAYNTSLFAAGVAKWGEAKTEAWLAGVKANLARKPSGGDRDVAKDIASGLCDIGIGNTYYVGLMLNREPDRKPWAEAIRVVMPRFEGGGTHVNISGIAMARHAPNKAAALKLAEWLVSDAAQSLYAQQNFEHPIRPTIAPDATVIGFGALQADDVPLIEIAANRRKASALVDKVGFNQGP
jgi:iron(III) transport system substrate-binding protein